jgi:integrase
MDFRMNGLRFREQTTLSDTLSNRRKLQRLLDQIELEIKTGKFDYARHVPNSRNVQKLTPVVEVEAARPVVRPVAPAVVATAHLQDTTPFFRDFIEEWIAESQIGWRRSHLINIRGMAKKHYLPYFGSMRVGHITRADILKFRSSLAKISGRNGNETLSANRINKIMDPLRRVFEVAADRHDFTTPYQRIKPLKIRKSDVHPFTLTEVQRIVRNVRPDFRHYYTVRFFTGMRTGEIDGLKWTYVDFECWRALKIDQISRVIIAQD